MRNIPQAQALNTWFEGGSYVQWGWGEEGGPSAVDSRKQRSITLSHTIRKALNLWTAQQTRKQ